MKGPRHRKVSNMPKGTQLESGRPGMHTQAVGLQNPSLSHHAPLSPRMTNKTCRTAHCHLRRSSSNSPWPAPACSSAAPPAVQQSGEKECDPERGVHFSILTSHYSLTFWDSGMLLAGDLYKARSFGESRSIERHFVKQRERECV